MSKHRGMAVLALLIIVGSATTGGLYIIQPAPRPDPRLDSRQAVLQYLVVGNLETDPEVYQVSLVDRLMDELSETPQLPTSAVDQLPAGYRDQLNQNLEVLKRAWFYSRCERYHELDPAEENAFLDQQIKAVLDWSRFDLDMQADVQPTDADALRAAYAREFFGEIRQWIAEAEAEEQPQLELAVRRALIRWLSTRSLEEEPLGTRQALAKTIVRELDQGLELKQVIASLQPAEQQQLSANSLLLIEAWLHELALEYEQLPEAEREAYVDRRLDQVMKWDLASLMTSPAEGQSQGSSAMGTLQASLKLFGIINGWIQRADEASRPRFEAFMMHLQQRWAARQFSR